MRKKIIARKDTKCPYCLNNEFVDVVDRRPDQDLVQCADVSCALYFVIRHGTESFPLAIPDDPDSLPGRFTVIEVKMK